MAVALEQVTGRKPAMVWHKDSALPDGTDFVAFPADFPMAIICARARWPHARRSWRAVTDAAARGVPVVGICNGFQVLTEAGLLPGALMRNAGLSFVCRPVPLRVENSQCLFTAAYDSGEADPLSGRPPRRQLPGRRGDPRPARGRGPGRVPLPRRGQRLGARIAGILNDAGNVLGLMPHPERAVEAAHGCTDGRRLFEGLLETVS